jgi:hypothetical protein
MGYKNTIIDKDGIVQYVKVQGNKPYIKCDLCDKLIEGDRKKLYFAADGGSLADATFNPPMNRPTKAISCHKECWELVTEGLPFAGETGSALLAEFTKKEGAE